MWAILTGVTGFIRVRNQERAARSVLRTNRARPFATRRQHTTFLPVCWASQCARREKEGISDHRRSSGYPVGVWCLGSRGGVVGWSGLESCCFSFFSLCLKLALDGRGLDTSSSSLKDWTRCVFVVVVSRLRVLVRCPAALARRLLTSGHRRQTRRVRSVRDRTTNETKRIENQSILGPSHRRADEIAGVSRRRREEDRR